MGSQGLEDQIATSSMKIEKIYVYPIKSFRATELDSAALTKHGLRFDRCFMMLDAKKDETGKPSYRNMAITNFNQMVRYTTKIIIPADGDVETGEIQVTYHPVGEGQDKQLMIPLLPKTSGLEKVNITMHLSSTEAFKMPDDCNAWFSECFGFDVVLAYLGDNRRQVLMSSNTRPQPIKPCTDKVDNSLNGWVSSLISRTSSLLSWPAAEGEETGITFADCAPYLIVSSKSMEDVHRRLPDGMDMDISKFRPNIIISGAEQIWEEDFWRELSIAGQPVWECVHNCGRCKSINIDYETGKQGETASGKILKELSRDRRVDPGMKWSPIFGRYSFLHPLGEGRVIRVGDEVKVSKKSEERTRFDWEGLCTK
nr:uncharacterized protein ycbx [Quercus suber]